MAAKRKSLRGRLLLDGGNLSGSWFHRAVVLVCQHDAEGAFGLVLNRLTGSSLGDAVESDLPESAKSLGLRAGGPVQTEAFSFLSGGDFLPNGSVMPGIDHGHSIEDFMELLAAGPSSQRLLAFAGYSGWSAGQLEEELARSAWVVHPATPKLVFDPDPTTLWRRILRGKGGLFRLLSDSPEDLGLN